MGVEASEPHVSLGPQDISFNGKRHGEAVQDVERSHQRALANVQLRILLTSQGTDDGLSTGVVRPSYFLAQEGQATEGIPTGDLQYCQPASPSNSSHTLLEFHDIDAVLIAAAMRGAAGCPVLPEPALRINEAQMQVR